MGKMLTCRTCLKKELPEFCKNISPEVENEETSNILEMLNYCVPELDIYLVVNPFICRNCINSLEVAFKFKTECLSTEEKFLKYSQSTNSSKVDLNKFYKNVHQSINKKNMTNNNKEVLSDVKIIKVERVSPVEVETKTPKFNCTDCIGCQNMLTDPSSHSKNYTGPCECHNCGKKVNGIMDIRKHMTSHSRKRKCKICNRYFRDLYQLTNHIRIHTGAKPFTCELCMKSFRQKHNLDQHLRQHQGHSSVKCKRCDKSFSTKYNLKIHIRSLHSKKPECELCGEKFRTKVALIKHLETDSETCGNFVKTEALEESIEEIIIKTEPEFVSANDNLLNIYKQESCENDQMSTLKGDIDMN